MFRGYWQPLFKIKYPVVWACDMLAVYIEVNEILKEELMTALNNYGSSVSYLGKLREWTNNLPNNVHHRIHLPPLLRLLSIIIVM